MKIIKEALRQFARALGYEIARVPQNDSASGWVPPPHALVHSRIELLLDVGANSGQFGREVRNKGYAGKIVSFEPLPDAHAKLEAAARSDAKWLVHPRGALGSTPAEMEINVSANSLSSSIRTILPAHIEAASHASYIGRVKTPVFTLDSVIGSYRQAGERTYLKIDTQGYEREVLLGAARSLSDICAIQLEMSLVPLYEGQALYQEMFEFMWDNGFTLWGLQPEFMDLETGRQLQFDATFVRHVDPATHRWER